ncbi:cytochrome P450 [Nonomuraea sp. NPDC049695]|uniref:cytochrome P450 n=1 Tax=Nonomuraea sp. NPDC049695 TaxID=3154734 RepID=UPI003417665C
MSRINHFPFEAGPFGAPPLEHRRRQTDEPLGSVIFPTADEVVLAVRYDDVRAILGSSSFSMEALQLGHADAPLVLARTAPPRMVGALMNTDPPDHTRLRRIVTGLFTPARIEELRPRAVRLADELIDDMGAPPLDFIDAFAGPFSAHLLLDLLGTPENGRENVVRHFDGFTFTSSLTLAERMRKANEFNRHVVGLLMEARLGGSVKGLVGALTDARAEEGRLTEEELHGLIYAIVGAGHGTTVGMLTRAACVLVRHPDQFGLLAGSPSLVKSAVEELFRLEIPGEGGQPRIATEDVELPSGVIPKGAAVLPSIASANRDETYFRDPDVFDVHRSPNPHMAFGYGHHYCLGASLARMQLQVMVQQFAERVPTLRLAVPAEELVYTNNGATRGLSSLPVTFDPPRPRRGE